MRERHHERINPDVSLRPHALVRNAPGLDSALSGGLAAASSSPASIIPSVVPPLGAGIPPEVQENWIPITAAFVVPTVCGVFLEGTLPLKPGTLFFIGLFTGLIASLIASVVTVVRAHKGDDRPDGGAGGI